MRRTTRLLVISRHASGMNDQVETTLRAAFADHAVVDFDGKHDLARLVTVKARIIVAGGDGTVEHLVRRLADTRHPIGIIPLGRFNNLAKALRLPTALNDAIAVAREGRPRPITLGRVNDHIFVEACAIGLFGETIALGESAKDMQFGKLATKLMDVIAAPRFQYEISGDLEGSGSAMSLVFSNISSIGGLLPISDADPMTPELEFSVHAGETRSDIALRAIKAAILAQHSERGTGQVFRFKSLTVKTKPRVRVYADNEAVGRTPANVRAEVSAVRVLMPAP